MSAEVGERLQALRPVLTAKKNKQSKFSALYELL